MCDIINDNNHISCFFCQIKEPDEFHKKTYLITKNNAINKIMQKNEYIEIKFNNNTKKILLNIKRNIRKNEKLNVICIEILNEDGIILDTFELDDNCYDITNDVENYNRNNIIISGIYKEFELYKGIVSYLNSNEKIFGFDSNVKHESSGEPIFLFNNLKLIGINKGYDKKLNLNVGIFFNQIIKEINAKSNEKIKFYVDEDGFRKYVSYNKNITSEDFMKDYLNKYHNLLTIDTTECVFIYKSKILNSPAIKNKLLKDIIRENALVKLIIYN